MKEIWKKFDETELTHSSAHHLMAIHTLLKENGYARGIDIAHYLDITRGSVSITLNKLKAKGYISEDSNKFYQLTESGQQVVDSILSKRHIVESFFRDVLQIPAEIAEEDACKVEHLLTRETGQRMMTFLGYYLSENPEAKSFREGLHSFSYLCRETGECEICEVSCYLAGKADMETS